LKLEQAEALLKRLEAAFNHDLMPDTRGIYIEKLMTLPLATGTKRVEKLITSARFFPKIAELMQPSEDELISQNSMVRNTWVESPEAKYAIYRSEKLIGLDEATYLQYISRDDVKARLENEWRHTWEQEHRL
jgi:hypothetical protein